MRIGVLVVIAALLLTIVVLLLRPAPMPRILDEHGNNIVYHCPEDPRCHPTPTVVKR